MKTITETEKAFRNYMKKYHPEKYEQYLKLAG